MRIEIVATRCQILWLKCTKFNFGPHHGAYSTTICATCCSCKASIKKLSALLRCQMRRTWPILQFLRIPGCVSARTFLLCLTIENSRRYKRKSVEVGIFRRGGSLWAQISDEREHGQPTSHCWYQKTGVIALACGIKISVVHCLVLSQSRRVTDRQTDGRTNRITTANTALA